ncbi:MAG TPA: hybrid sensor histidine kinase/response regulator [Polyangiaceae bacterium]|jgi:signal transduction histidine kinase
MIPASSPIKILVIDDHEQNRAFARAALEEEGYSVILAASGEEGIERYLEHSPDCVLLDVRMPGLDGFATCARIRELPHGAETPVVFLTAQRDLDTFDAALRAGGDDFLTKPVRPTELLLRVQASLKLRRAYISNREYVELARRQRDDLMRLQLQKERLMGFVVHDLKNPVGNIDLQAQLLVRDRLSPEAREAGAHIREEVRSLMRLLLNLLDLSKSEEGRLVPARTSVDLVGLVRDVCDALAGRARAREISLRQAVEADSVDADPDLLRRVLENLLENALRHAPSNSVVTVTAARVGAGLTELGVADSGEGVPPALRDAIFDRFVQVDKPDQPASRSGRGLGLAFCRLAIEAHGGRIWVEDAQPGALFLLSIPHAE